MPGWFWLSLPGVVASVGWFVTHRALFETREELRQTRNWLTAADQRARHWEQVAHETAQWAGLGRPYIPPRIDDLARSERGGPGETIDPRWRREVEETAARAWRETR